jgi:hypothetical protein
MTQAQAEWHQEFPDIKWKLGNVVEQREHVTFRYVAEGTHKPTGKKASWTGSGVAIVKAGKIVNLQIVEDFLGRYADIGVVAPMPQDDMSGNWTGQLWGIDFVLHAEQKPPAHDVIGNLSGLGQSLAVSGKNDPPNVTLAGNSPKGPVTFNGIWTGPNTLSGTLNGAGFQNQAVEFHRQ